MLTSTNEFLEHDASENLLVDDHDRYLRERCRERCCGRRIVRQGAVGGLAFVTLARLHVS